MLRLYLKLNFNTIACTGIFLTHLLIQSSFQASWAENSVSYYRQQGLAYRSQKLYPQAIAALEKSVKLAPQDLNGRIILGWTLHLAGNQKQAERSLFQALYINPFSVQACNALGIVYLVQGDLLPAAVVHNWAAILKPNNEIAYYNLSLAYHRLGFFNWAIANAEIAIKLEPDNPHPLVAKALAAWDQGDRTLAKQIFKKAISLDGRYADSEFLNFLDEAGFSLGQIALSKKILRVL